MTKVLKGNFEVKKQVKDEERKAEINELESLFEKEALKHLGGSIAFVSKRKVLWEEKEKLNVKKNNKPKK